MGEKFKHKSPRVCQRVTCVPSNSKGKVRETLRWHHLTISLIRFSLTAWRHHGCSRVLSFGSQKRPTNSQSTSQIRESESKLSLDANGFRVMWPFPFGEFAFPAGKFYLHFVWSLFWPKKRKSWEFRWLKCCWKTVDLYKTCLFIAAKLHTSTLKIRDVSFLGRFPLLYFAPLISNCFLMTQRH